MLLIWEKADQKQKKPNPFYRFQMGEHVFSGERLPIFSSYALCFLKIIQ